MAHKLEIDQSQLEASGRVDLRGMLDAIGPFGALLTWVIFDIEAVGELPDGKRMSDLEHEVRESPHGLRLSWQSLVRLAGHMDDVWNMLAVGYLSADEPPVRTQSGLGCQSYAITIELLDSTVWRIAAKDAQVLRRVANALLE